jgi:Protein of unknown function (DUF4127)
MIAALSFVFGSIAFVPMDDRPVTERLPVMLGQIAGVAVDTPPSGIIGHYLVPSRSDAIIAWLNRQASNRRTEDFVVSSDALGYGGLLASRIPGVTYADAYFRMKEFAHLRAERPEAWIGAFGTIMRLAPTGVPAGVNYFAAYPLWSYIQQYANLHDPPLASEMPAIQRLQALIGQTTLDAYLATRARNLAVDRLLISLAATGTLDRLVLGQDDAGPVGLHVREVAWLQSVLAADPALESRASIEPGADELGMALVAHALARKAGWTPHVAVTYSTPDGAAYQDPLEYASISTAIEGLIRLCGGVHDDAHPDITLFVRVPRTTGAQDTAFADAIESSVSTGHHAALADLSYLVSYESQAVFARNILRSGVAAKLDAYASWNTNANTVGTALAEAVAAGAGRRMHSYDRLAHREFTFARFVDDYAYHDFVRPDLNATLTAEGIADHMMLAPAVAAATAQRDRALLWSHAAEIVSQLDPGYHIAALDIGLPWDRTFETSVDVGLAPNL